MTDHLVETHALSKTYAVAGGVVSVLSGVDCHIDASDRIALIGPSGSGKSTLLHILAGLVEPSQGQVQWPALGARDQLMPLRVQTVFQVASLFPALTVQDNIALPLLLAGEVAQPGLTPQALLDEFGLSELALKLPEELSGGQAQRVAMLRALSVAPRLILADEPTGQLDSKTAQDFLTGVIAMADATGAALLIATHDPAVAARMDRQWSIDHGELWSDTNRTETPA
ncbi:MAG: ABC transporter ATP-binding protein [Cypionkella sp.]